VTTLLLVGAAVGLYLFKDKVAEVLGTTVATPADVRAAILEMCSNHPSIYPPFAFAVAQLESGFRAGAVLDTRGRANLPAGTQQENSLGIFQVNVNPSRPVGQARIEQLRQEGHTPTDLLDPRVCAEFWAKHIAGPLIRRARSEGRTGDDVWFACRVWLFASTLDPEGETGQAKIRKFRPVFEAWKARLG